MSGSPPPMRGKGIVPEPLYLFVRITPAYAGKRNNAIFSHLFTRDHPRLCGEKFILNHLEPLSRRITPAYAGKRKRIDNVRHPSQDHPRLCGEKPTWEKSADLILGSPPPMRGKDRCKNTRLCGGQDHPRLCGEKSSTSVLYLTIPGSPPPMRGKVYNSSRVEQRNRITPAYAGKSRICWRKSRGIWDHPRLCGEKGNTRLKACSEKGSPPPMRGKVKSLSISYVGNRITPAYAGKSSKRGRCGKLVRDHPRLCGEKFSIFPTCGVVTGSPPPMRGKVL